MTYKDISILQFQRLHSAVLHHKENIYEIGMEILDIFEGVPVAESKNWKVKEFDKRLQKYAFLNTELPSDKWVKEFECEGVTYKVMQTPDKWNVGQFVSMANLTKDPDKIVDNLHIIVAVMCTADEMQIPERSRLFQEKLSAEVAYPLALFFCAVMLKLPTDIQHSLKVVDR